MDTSENFELPKGTDDYPWVECEMVAKLGLTHEALAELRNAVLVKNRDFITHKRRICWSAEGLLRILSALGLPADSFAEKPAPAPVETFVVHRSRVQNPKIVLASDGNGRVVRVRVKHKENFRPGMRMQCKQADGDLYDLVGSCPKRPGKY